VANFDRLGILLTLSGQKAAEGINPATDEYRDVAGQSDSANRVVTAAVDVAIKAFHAVRIF
jgi:hypothetical protein